ncbi:MAG: YkgJ family cysteine cluster protein [Planctomycetes bacterium]|nr:YkgJ family cysteine cluster protein [Planctomycetota bacterium]
MKLEIHPEMLRLQKYSCNCCGQGCRSFLVPVTPAEREKIEKQENWRDDLGVKELFVKHRATGNWGWGLAKRPDGRCVFLDKDNLCIIHKKRSLRAKPIACQLYPFVLNPIGGTIRLGLRFDCPAVCRSEGSDLSSFREELRRYIRHLNEPNGENAPPPEVYPQQQASLATIEAINETILKIIDSDAIPLADRLQWLRGLTEHFALVKWAQLEDHAVREVLNMLHSGVFVEQNRQTPKRQAIKGKPRKMLGQMFFLLAQPTTIITAESKGWFKNFDKRIKLTRQMRQLGHTSGALPKIQPGWPDCDMRDLETSFGEWSKKVQRILSRYLTCRIASFGYCGTAFYGYSITEGLESLLWAMVTIGYLMRIEALNARRKHIVSADAHQAIMKIDGNLGYSTALGFGPDKLRLRYLREHLEGFIDWYCR